MRESPARCGRLGRSEKNGQKIQKKIVLLARSCLYCRQQQQNLLITQCWSQKLYSKCASPALTRAAETKTPQKNSCTMTYCQHGYQPNQIYKFSPKSYLFRFLQSIKFLLRIFFQQLSAKAEYRCYLLPKGASSMTYENFRGKVYTYLVK